MGRETIYSFGVLGMGAYSTSIHSDHLSQGTMYNAEGNVQWNDWALGSPDETVSNE